MSTTTYDVAVIGGGIAGMATAARLQARGYSTVVIEAHGQVGGCAGYFRRRGFAFDTGATTLVDFEPGGVGGQLLEEVGLTLDAERLPGYVAWLPDRKVTLHRDAGAWRRSGYSSSATRRSTGGSGRCSTPWRRRSGWPAGAGSSCPSRAPEIC